VPDACRGTGYQDSLHGDSVLALWLRRNVTPALWAVFRHDRITAGLAACAVAGQPFRLWTSQVTLLSGENPQGQVSVRRKASR